VDDSRRPLEIGGKVSRLRIGVRALELSLNLILNPDPEHERFTLCIFRLNIIYPSDLVHHQRFSVGRKEGRKEGSEDQRIEGRKEGCVRRESELLVLDAPRMLRPIIINSSIHQPLCSFFCDPVPPGLQKSTGLSGVQFEAST